MSRAAPAAPSIYPAYCFSAASTFKKWVKLTAADVQALRAEPGFDCQNIYFHLNHPIEFVYLAGPVVAVDHLVTRYNTRFTLLELDDGSGASIPVKVAYKPASRAGGHAQPHQPAAGNPTVLHHHDDNIDDSDADADASSDNNAADRLDHPSADPRAKALLTTRVFATTVEQLTVKSGPRGTELLLGDEAIEVGTVLKAKGTLQRWRGSFQLNLRRAFIVRSLDEEARVWSEYAEFATAVLSKPWVLTAAQVDALRAAEEENAAKEKQRAERRRERDKEKLERRRAWEKKRERYERRAERKRVEEEKELDGNALDRPGWTPFVPPGERAGEDALRLESSSLPVQRREDVGFTTARALLYQEQLQQTRQMQYQAGPVRWQHEYAQGTMTQGGTEGLVEERLVTKIPNRRKLDPG